MLLYHSTLRKNVPLILEHGFDDSAAGRFVDQGVWFADIPLIGNEMFEDEPGLRAAIKIDIPENLIAEHEQPMPEGDDQRHRHLPYDLANQYLTTAQVEEFYPEGFVQEYDGYWIVRTEADVQNEQIGGGMLRMRFPIFQAVHSYTGVIVAEMRTLADLMLYIHSDLPRI